MPNTNKTVSRSTRKPQPVAKAATDTAPAAAVKDQGDDAMFDDAPPPATPPVAPADPAASSETSPPPVVAPVSSPAEGAEQEPSAPAEPVVPAQPEPTPPPPPPPVDDAVTAPVVDEAMEAPAPSRAAPVRIRLGQVEGLLHRVPTGTVQMLLASSESRIEALRPSPAIASLQPRVRVTEGRCAPIIFTLEQVEGAAPHLFAGLEGFVAGLNLGLEAYPVIIIDAGDAGAAQSHLVNRAMTAPADPHQSPFEVIE